MMILWWFEGVRAFSGQADPPKLCCHPMRTIDRADSIGPHQILRVVSVSNHLRKPSIMFYPALLIEPFYARAPLETHLRRFSEKGQSSVLDRINRMSGGVYGDAFIP